MAIRTGRFTYTGTEAQPSVQIAYGMPIPTHRMRLFNTGDADLHIGGEDGTVVHPGCALDFDPATNQSIYAGKDVSIEGVYEYLDSDPVAGSPFRNGHFRQPKSDTTACLIVAPGKSDDDLYRVVNTSDGETELSIERGGKEIAKLKPKQSFDFVASAAIGVKGADGAQGVFINLSREDLRAAGKKPSGRFKLKVDDGGAKHTAVDLTTLAEDARVHYRVFNSSDNPQEYKDQPITIYAVGSESITLHRGQSVDLTLTADRPKIVVVAEKAAMVEGSLEMLGMS